MVVLAYFAAGIALVALCAITAAAGIYLFVRLIRSSHHKDEVAKAKHAMEMEVTRSIARMIADHVNRLEQIGTRVSDVSVDTYLAELNSLYTLAEVVPEPPPKNN